MHHQTRFEAGGGKTKSSSSMKCTSMNDFDLKERRQQKHQPEILQNYNEHEYIFGSTSPRGMSTSDYVGVGGSYGVGVGGGSGGGTMQKDSNESDNNISSCSTLDIVNKVENLTRNDTEAQIRELSQRLQKTEKERNEFKRKLDEAVEEKERCNRRLEVVSSAHESRITEMHCVIAELSKKLRSKQDNIIMEENEVEGSEISYQEGSIYNSELNLTNPDAECQTDPLDGDYSLEDPKIINETVAKSQVEALQEEVLHLKAQIALLQSQIASNNPCSEGEDVDRLAGHDDVSQGSNELEYDDVDDINLNGEKKLNCFYDDVYYNKTDDNEIEGTGCHAGEGSDIINEVDKSHSKELYVGNLDDSNLCLHSSSVQSGNKFITKDHYQCQVKNSANETPIPKMAERVKLRRTVEDQHITGTNILSTGINNTEIVEHLVSDLIQTNSMMDSFIEPSQLDTEFQRLTRRIEHLKLRNSMLSLTLDECKEHCDHLYLLCGKYESNAIALQSALNCSDRAIEAYDVMLALLESKLAILKENSPAAEESRRAVESVARHLLDRLESEKNLSENSLGPWQNTFCLSDKPYEPWTTEDDNRLRNHVSKLKGRRSTVQNTIVSLESPFSSSYEKAQLAFENNTESKPDGNTKLDLEMAVLMQELLGLRDEVTESKRKREEAERERQFAIEKICLLQESLQHLQTQLSESEAFLNLTTREQQPSFTEADQAALTEQQLVEALSRESELKNRIQSLIGTVSASRKSSDEKYAQVQSNIKDLQKININLSQTMEHNKRKYQSKIKRLEQKIVEMGLELNHHQHHLQHQQQHHQRGLSHDNVPETTL